MSEEEEEAWIVVLFYVIAIIAGCTAFYTLYEKLS